MQENPWLYNGNPLNEPPDGYQGFVYLITNTNTGKKYIGKKTFWNTNRVKQKGKSRRKVVKKESDWKSYYGSNDQLKADIESHGTSGIIREIIQLCRTKSEMSYFETKEIFSTDAIIREEYYNQWISARIHGGNLKLQP